MNYVGQAYIVILSAALVFKSWPDECLFVLIFMICMCAFRQITFTCCVRGVLTLAWSGNIIATGP